MILDKLSSTQLNSTQLNSASHLERWLTKGKKLKELNHIPILLKTVK